MKRVICAAIIFAMFMGCNERSENTESNVENVSNADITNANGAIIDSICSNIHVIDGEMAVVRAFIAENIAKEIFNKELNTNQANSLQEIVDNTQITLTDFKILSTDVESSDIKETKCGAIAEIIFNNEIKDSLNQLNLDINGSQIGQDKLDSLTSNKNIELEYIVKQSDESIKTLTLKP